MQTPSLTVKVLLIAIVLAVLGATASIVPRGWRGSSWAKARSVASSPLTHDRSIGTNTGVLYDTGSASVSAGSSAVVFDSAHLPGTIGRGDMLILDSDSAQEETLYILSRDSDTQVTLQTPVSHAHVTVPYIISRAYYTIQDWVDDRRGNLVAQNRLEVGVLYNDGPFTASRTHALATIDGSKTDATHFMWLTVAEGQQHKGIAESGVVLDGENTTKLGLRIRDHYTRVEGVELRRFRGADGAAAVEVREAKQVLLAQLLIHDFADDRFSVVGIKGSDKSDFTVRNCLIYNGDTAGIRTTDRGTATIENCTIFGMAGRGIFEDEGTYTVRNTIAMDNPRGDFDLKRGKQSHNLSSDETAAGPGSLTHKDPVVQFVSLIPGLEDLHLRADADAIGAGRELSAFFTEDIDGDPRLGAWDMGADQATSVAIAGPDVHTRTGMSTALDGSASYDPRGDLLTFQWFLVEAPTGSEAIIADPSRPNPPFVPDLPGSYVFELIVDNGQGVSRPDRMTLTAFTDNAPPNARAGRDQYARVGRQVFLDGRSSADPEQAALAFQWWLQSAPPRSRATLARSDSPTPVFTPDVQGTYVLTLHVSHGVRADEATMRVFARRAPVAPHANAGLDQTVQGVQEVTLDGSGSFDPDRRPTRLRFAWRFVALPGGSALTNADFHDATTARPRFTPDVEGAYVLRLTVNDGQKSDADNVLVFVDRTSPTLQFRGPTDGAIMATNTPRLAVTFSDDGAGIAAATLRFQANAQVLGVTCGFEGTSSAVCTPTAPLPEGAVTLAATIADQAGNTSDPAEVHCTVDTTPPVIIAVATPPANANGWHNGPVLVTFSATDTLSGVAPGSLTPPMTLAVDGTNLSASGQATDLAGNVGSATLGGINIDQTNPAIEVALSPAPNANGWYNTPVMLHFTCTDAGAGIASCPPDQAITTEGADQTITGTATDRADNAAATVGTVSLDTTPPALVITSPADGAVVSTPTVTMTGTVTDALSGVASVTSDGQAVAVQPDYTFSHGPLALVEGLNTFTLIATDRAGNTRQQAVGVTRGCTNLVSDPGFESGISGFVAQDASTQVSQTDISPLEGSRSLLVAINGWGNQVWWTYGIAGGRASRLRVSSQLRSDISSSSNLQFCAAAYYADGSFAGNCTPVPGDAGDKGTVSAGLDLDPAQALGSVHIRLYQEGGDPVRFSIDSAAACLEGVSAPPPPPPPPPSSPPPPPLPWCVSGNSGDGSGVSNGGAAGPFSDGVTVHLTRTFAGGDLVSFGVPVPPGVNLTDVSSVRVLRSGAPLDVSVRALLETHDRCGVRIGIRALQIQFDASFMTGDEMDVDVVWRGTTGNAPATTLVAHGEDRVSSAAPETVDTTVRTITSSSGVNTLVEAPHVQKTLFIAREPYVLATFPDGYLAGTGILGQQVTAAEAHQPPFAGLSFLSDAVSAFGLSSMYAEGYALNPDPDSVVDPVANFEGWLYDRCATYLAAYVHTNDARFLREAYRTCWYYASKINLTGSDAGIFSGKPDPDPKYSHLRGLYAYYALTGDELASQAGTAIAEMWYADPSFVVPYRAGHTRGPDKLWTERLLGTSFEGLYYGHRLTGDPKYLFAFGELFETAYRHITGDAATLAEINPGIPVSFPPQNCFIHTAEQHAEGNAAAPWCSSWMSELIIDALLRYEEQTGDARPGEVFVRLARFLRDVGSSYFRGNPLDDYFLQPSIPYDPTDIENPRLLVPLYGSGLGPDLVRRNYGDYNDFEHCTDATALTAAALRALKAQGGYDQNPIGPFASEGASFLQLHHEFAACAATTFAYQTRTRRDPRVWSSADLAPGLADPPTFIRDNKIGYPVHNIAPQRKLSWWFNMSMLQFGLLTEAGITVPALMPGFIQP